MINIVLEAIISHWYFALIHKVYDRSVNGYFLLIFPFILSLSV